MATVTSAPKKKASTLARPARKPRVPAKVAAPTKASVPATSAPKPAEAPASKVKKPKLVRDSFTFPQADYDQIARLKKRALSLKLEVKKSELLRAGLRLLSGLSDRDLVAHLKTVEKIKPGRPAKH